VFCVFLTVTNNLLSYACNYEFLTLIVCVQKIGGEFKTLTCIFLCYMVSVLGNLFYLDFLPYTEDTGRSPVCQHPPHIPRAVMLLHLAYFHVFPFIIAILSVWMLVVITIRKPYEVTSALDWFVQGHKRLEEKQQ
jgi:hypothetical protein